MVNNITITGRLTKDPESAYTPNGVAVAKFSVAVDRDFKNPETGERETDFFNCVAWRKTAEFVTAYVNKGRLIAVEGRMQCRSWVTQAGDKVRVWELVGDKVTTLDKRPQDEIAEQVPEGEASRELVAAGIDGQVINDPFADD